MKRPLVSVVIPTRNRPHLVSLAVQSALAQTLDDLEVWVVDDGSEPPVALPDPQRADARVRLIRLAASTGAGNARNVGAGNARGELLAFLDDDDEWYETKLAEQIEALVSADGRTVAVESGFELRDGDRALFRYLPSEGRDLARTLMETPCLQPSTVLIRKSAFDALGGFDASLPRVEDWELWIRLADHFDVAVIGRVHVYRRVNPHPPVAAALAGFRCLVARLEPRIATLPAQEQARVRALHTYQEGVLLAQAGDRRGASAAFWRAWRANPRAYRALANLPRPVAGERAWESVRRLYDGGRRVALPALGRDPLLRSW